MHRTENNHELTRVTKSYFAPDVKLSAQQDSRMKLTAHRPMSEQLKTYIHALAGPSERVPLIYTWEPHTSLDRLHRDVVSHYRELATVLGDHERNDLTTKPPPLLTAFNYRSGLDPQLSSDLNHSSLDALDRLRLRGYNGSGVDQWGVSSAGPSQYRHQADLIGGGPGLGVSGPSFGPFVPSRSPHESVISPPPNMPALEAIGGIGVRASTFAVRGAATQGLNYEETRLVYPPVGSTFDGHASRSVMDMRREAGRGAGIDTLSDLRYRRNAAKSLQSEMGLQDMVQSSWVPRSQMRSQQDQLDSFLSDYAHGRIGGMLAPPSLAYT
ncbi:hypothetical protein CEUSTIGMA_g12394.t1 [Chlamydomonas eustigma]|uniref:Uncharacterized protein n=1 Tax=Chlamydomonas eustigma TaxID=1157962 RepID=A0A250XPP1_9CHLO|nr:hypothetical protein CEUSTIGMA_g12394.t1 [Chlamydomonas eustigma]|eukprot:GAX84973.1 hypothetical protein CEUSTIGMA_g12394.t1 [Chlamydomonas eustigma]